MILIGFLALIIVAVLSQIVLFKGTNFLGKIENKYRDGIAVELSSAEELKNKIIETSSNVIKGATINTTEQVEVVGNTGTHLFYLENGCVKCELVKYGFRITRIGRFLAWLKIVPKMKMANEIDIIFENLSGNKTNEAENEKIIKSVSGKTTLTSLLAIISVVLIIFSVTSMQKDDIISVNSDVYVETIQATNLEDSEYTYEEIFNDFFANPTWEHFTSEDGKDVVEFTGECTYDESEVKVTIQYLITNETETTLEWELVYFDIDGESQELSMFDGMVKAAIESYQQ